MFSKAIIGSARFLRMPPSSRLLYYDLGMYADDEGIVEAFTVMRQTGSTEDDLRVLVAKGFVRILNEDLVTVITDWNENNYIRGDRKKKSIYNHLLLAMSDTCPSSDSQLADTCPSNVSIGKDRIGEDRVGKDSIGKGSIGAAEAVIEEWNKLPLKDVKSINANTNRHSMLNARISEYGLDAVIEAIRSIADSDFLLGQNKRNWTITFDWFIRPNNFLKVYEGNYVQGKENTNGQPEKSQEEMDSEMNFLEELRRREAEERRIEREKAEWKALEDEYGSNQHQ